FELSYDLPPELSERFFTGAVLRHLTFTQSIGEIGTLKLLFNGPLWSLVLEMYFYLVFPLLLLLLKPVRSAGQIAALFVVGILLQLTLIELFLPETDQYNIMNLNVPVYTNPFIRVIEFIFGMLLYKAFVVNNWFAAPPSLRLTPVLVSIVLYMAVIMLSSWYTPYQYHAFFLSVPFVTLMIYRLLELRWHPGSRAVKFCTLLGGVSYVLYCFHWPVMEMLQFSDLLPELPTPLHVLLLMTLLLLLSLVIYRWIESPLRRLLYRITDGESRRL
ncbi:MAG: acyltransferase, partial [Gammaproteobacteria bacterium]